MCRTFSRSRQPQGAQPLLRTSWGHHKHHQHPLGVLGWEHARPGYRDAHPPCCSPPLTRQEGVGGGVGLLLADVGEGDAAVAVLPPPRRLGADHPTVLLTGVVGLVWKAGRGDTLLRSWGRAAHAARARSEGAALPAPTQSKPICVVILHDEDPALHAQDCLLCLNTQEPGASLFYLEMSMAVGGSQYQTQPAPTCPQTSSEGITVPMSNFG